MSSLFGQVWLWSLLSFVAGVALTWLVMVRPARRELEDLEERLLTSPRPAPSSAPMPSPAPVQSAASSSAPKAQSRDEFDSWHVETGRSLTDEVLTPASAPARYESAGFEHTGFDHGGFEHGGFEHNEPPRYDVANMKLDQREELLEELDDEHRPLSDFEEEHDFPEFEAEPPRSLFERLGPGTPDTRETLEPKPRPRPHPPRPHPTEEEPELPAEVTHTMRAIPVEVPVAEVAPRLEEPVAPPEVEVFQPREVWREEPVKEVYDQDEVPGGPEEEDEPDRGSAEQTAFIPATALAQAIAEVDGEARTERQESPRVWPEHDLTGHFTPVDVQSTRGEPAESVADGPQTEVMDVVVEPEPVVVGPVVEPEVAPQVVEPVEPAEPAASVAEVTRESRRPEATVAEPELVAEPEVTRFEPQPFEPRHGEPQVFEPRQFEPQAFESRHVQPEAFEPWDVQPRPSEPRHGEPQHVEPRHVEPRHGEPQHVERQSFEPERVETRSSEPQPAEQQRFEPEPFVPEPVGFAESRPAEPEPAEPEPVAFKPAEPEPEPAAYKPAEAEPEPKPVEPEPAEAKPVAPEPPAAKPAEPKPAAAKKKDEPARPRSLFEPLEDGDPELESGQTRPAPPPSSGNDQPFVPTLAPELLAGNPVPMTPTGLPQRPTRPTGAQRTPPPAPLAPKPITPPPPRPVRPRPVGFSPSTGGRPAPGSTRFQGQQEGFNPRSPFGPGSVLPKSDGLAPAPEFQVKATLTGRRYFTSESANFRETRADVWFRTTADAEKAGFRQAP